MKILVALLLATAAAHAIPATATLTLVDEPSFNILNVTVSPQVSGFSLSSSDTTTLTNPEPGPDFEPIVARFDIDPITHQTSELTILGGRVEGSTLNFSRSIIFIGNVYTIAINDISAKLLTPAPPGTVTPATGSFVASQHAFEIDQGTVSGTANIPGSDQTIIDTAFSPETPVSGTGSGTGTVVLTPVGPPGLYQAYEVTITVPVSLSDVFDAEGTLVDVTASGTLKASGELQVPASPYLAWTIAENIPGADPQTDANQDGTPNALAWALGLGAFADASPHLLRPTAGGGFELPLPGTTAAPILVQTTTALGSWSTLPASRITPATNPLPPGAAGVVTIAPSTAPREFLRLQVTE